MFDGPSNTRPVFAGSCCLKQRVRLRAPSSPSA